MGGEKKSKYLEYFRKFIEFSSKIQHIGCFVFLHNSKYGIVIIALSIGWILGKAD